MQKLFLLIAVWYSLTNGLSQKTQQPKTIYAVQPEFQLLEFGQIQPQGWIYQQIIQDLDSGFAGHLNDVAPKTCASQIFGAKRNAKNKLQSTGGSFDGTSESFWWNGETEGNWRSGNLMMCLMAKSPKYRAMADSQVMDILKMQDTDGYMGVYNSELRWQSGSTENGELWTQSCLLRGLIAYYEATKKIEVINAIEKAVQLTMKHYGKNMNNAFEKGEGGVYHGMMFIDVIERLYDLTGNVNYRDFGLFLYRNFSESTLNTGFDMGLSSLHNTTKGITQHGVHVYETMRAPIWASYADSSGKYTTARQMAVQKIWKYITPAGGPLGDEGIEDRLASPNIAYEGCSIKEWMNTLLSLGQKMGDSKYGDQAEYTFFNAAQGQRLYNGKGLMYLSKENRYEISGNGRDKFSPSHEDYANCCAPMFTNITPIYVRSMWMSSNDGIAAMLYGPCEVQTLINDIPVKIIEETSYPFSDQINMVVQSKKENKFSIRLRLPAWASKVNVQCSKAKIIRTSDWIIVTKKWKDNDKISIVFSPIIQAIPANNHEFYIQRGPLFYALPIAHQTKSVQQLPLNFENLAVSHNSKTHWNYAFNNICFNDIFSQFKLIENNNYNQQYPYLAPPYFLYGTMINLENKLNENIELVPMGCNDAMLRRMTFPNINK